MTRFIKLSSIALLVTLGLTGCSTLSAAYESVATTVSDAFKSDDAKK